MITIYSQLSQYVICFDCSQPGWQTQTIVQYPLVNQNVGACLFNSTGCKYNQFSSGGQCYNCEDVMPGCAICNNASACIMCN